jgi:aryl-alcohol dehydrogenase-like predicted oxidoreductase
LAKLIGRASAVCVGRAPGRFEDVKYRRLGDSDLEISEISLGSWLTYSGGVGFDAARACTEAAFDAGINFFDTANVYGTGAAEEAWGEILSAHPRDSYILATKVYFSMSNEDRGLSAEQIEKQLDASLARLRTDYLDLYQCHRFDTRTPIEETMEALTAAVDAGKVRYIGFSEWTPEQILAGLDVPGAAKLVSSQPQYNMIWRAPEAELFDLCREHDISNVVWSPLAQGVLSGKYEPGEEPPSESRALHDEMGASIQAYLNDELLEAVQRLRPIADGEGLTMVQLALAWILRRPEVASAITGASRPEQVHANAAASGVELSQGTLDAIDEALAGNTIADALHAPFAKEGVMHRGEEGSA